MEQPAGLPASRAPRVLLAWEFGAGRTHVLNLLGVARRLRAAGVECLATLYETRFAPEFAALGIPVVQNFVWPGRRRVPPPWKERPINGIGDSLANLGFAHGPSVGDAIAHYDGLLALFEPDLILAENAFGALLAARGRVPAIALGTSSCLPPVEARRLALFSGHGPDPSWSGAELLAGIDAGLAAAGREALPDIAALFDAGGAFPFGPAAFDPYAGQRTVPVLPPYVPDLPDAIPPSGGAEMFVYLHGFVQQNEGFMRTLADIGRPMRVYIPGLDDGFARMFVERGIAVENRPVLVEDMLTRSRCVLHHGGQQLTTICLAAGMPQALLPKEIDNRCAGTFLTRHGLGTAHELVGITVQQLLDTARAAFDDDAMRERCRAFAPQALDWLTDDPTRIVAEAAMKRLYARQ